MKLLTLCALLFLPVAAFASAKNWGIIPGKQVGQVAIGMERAKVLQLLGPPNREDDLDYLNDHGRLEQLFDTAKNEYKKFAYKDILRDDWTVPVALDGSNNYCFANFVSVYFREDRVAQIDVDVGRFQTAGGLTCKDSVIAWRKHYPDYSEVYYKSRHQSLGGWPAVKLFTLYDDDIKDGIAWWSVEFGNMAPDPDPNSPVVVSVHEPGKPVIVDPDGGGRYVYKDRPDRLSTDR